MDHRRAHAAKRRTTQHRARRRGPRPGGGRRARRPSPRCPPARLRPDRRGGDAARDGRVSSPGGSRRPAAGVHAIAGRAAAAARLATVGRDDGPPSGADGGAAADAGDGHRDRRRCRGGERRPDARIGRRRRAGRRSARHAPRQPFRPRDGRASGRYRRRLSPRRGVVADAPAVGMVRTADALRSRGAAGGGVRRGRRDVVTPRRGPEAPRARRPAVRGRADRRRGAAVAHRLRDGPRPHAARQRRPAARGRLHGAGQIDSRRRRLRRPGRGTDRGVDAAREPEAVARRQRHHPLVGQHHAADVRTRRVARADGRHGRGRGGLRARHGQPRTGTVRDRDHPPAARRLRREARRLERVRAADAAGRRGPSPTSRTAGRCCRPRPP